MNWGGCGFKGEYRRSGGRKGFSVISIGPKYLHGGYLRKPQ